jgi:hypothetical protein
LYVYTTIVLGIITQKDQMEKEDGEEKVYELIYSSTGWENIHTDDIDPILKSSIQYQHKRNLSGCILCHSNQLIHVLEGDECAVKELFKKIKQHNGHLDIELLEEEDTADRMFKNCMACCNLADMKMSNIERELLFDNLKALSNFSSKPTRVKKMFWHLSNLMIAEAMVVINAGLAS